MRLANQEPGCFWSTKLTRVGSVVEGIPDIPAGPGTAGDRSLVTVTSRSLPYISLGDGEIVQHAAGLEVLLGPLEFLVTLPGLAALLVAMPGRWDPIGIHGLM